jgi:hypothetical protein
MNTSGDIPNSSSVSEARSPVLPKLTPGVSISARDLLEMVDREVRRTLKQADRDPQKALRIGLTRIHESGHISDSDLRRLAEVVDAVVEVEREKRSTRDAALRINEIYKDALSDPTSSAVALIAMNASHSLEPEQVIAAWGLMGFFTGIAIGVAVGGGAEGATVGALVGIIVGTIIGVIEAGKE